LMELKQTDPEYFTKPNNIEDFAIQMIDIFNYMTKLGWSHRNLSPSNILCDNGKSKGSYLFKLCDWSSIVEKKVDVAQSPNYVAPEVIIKGGRDVDDKKANVYSLGLIVRELTGINKFEADSQNDLNINIEIVQNALD